MTAFILFILIGACFADCSLTNMQNNNRENLNMYRKALKLCEFTKEIENNTDYYIICYT